MIRMLKIVPVILMSLFLFACQESNPIIGTWEEKSVFKMKDGNVKTTTHTITYTKDKAKITYENGKTLEADILSYKKISDTEWDMTIRNKDNNILTTRFFVNGDKLVYQFINDGGTKIITEGKRKH